MSFTSPQFLIFFALVCGLSNRAKGRLRPYVLLGASLFFIGAFNMASLAAVIVFSSFTFVVAKYISRSKLLFYAALTINILAIVTFNYISASQGSLVFSLSAVEFDIGNLILVVGLSFYSLQHIAYLVDVQKKRIAAEINYIDFLLISVYFPKFISGPLTLYQQLNLNY